MLKKAQLHIYAILGKVLLIVFFLILLVIVIGYARGYRLNIGTDGKNSLVPTGIVAVSSNQKAAKVFVNGVLKGVTDINLTLPPGEYTIDVKREGYTDWTKKINLKGEIVLSLDAGLYPKNTSLSPLTNIGIVKAIPIIQTDKIVLFSQNVDPLKDGIYVFQPSKQPISFFPPLKLLALKSTLPADIDFKQTTITVAPDFSQGLFEFKSADGINTYSYLISLNDQNAEVITSAISLENLVAKWNEKKDKDAAKLIEIFPKDVQKVASDSFHIISFSPDETRVLYIAKRNTTLPPFITPPLIGTNQTLEKRTIQKGNVYVYDRKEDKNFLVPLSTFSKPVPTVTEKQTVTLYKAVTPTPQKQEDFSSIPTIMWLPDSKHLAIKEENEIMVIDYDGTSKRTIYSGPFEKDFFTVTEDGRLFILTNLNPQNNAYADLYEVGIR